MCTRDGVPGFRHATLVYNNAARACKTRGDHNCKMSDYLFRVQKICYCRCMREDRICVSPRYNKSPRYKKTVFKCHGAYKISNRNSKFACQLTILVGCFFRPPRDPCCTAFMTGHLLLDTPNTVKIDVT